MASGRAADGLQVEAERMEQWGGDPLAQFLAAAWRHTVRAISQEAERYRAIADVDAIYRRLVSNVAVNSQRLPATFLVRSHASFLAAASLALSGQAAEAYVLMRNAMEAALHGLFLAGSAERQQVWVSRNDDDQAQLRAHSMLGDGAPLAHLHEVDSATAAIYARLHARACDRAAHPNTYVNLSRTSPPGAGDVDFTREYFVQEDDVHRSCLRSLTQVGICCLTIFYYVFTDEYRELELDVSMNKLRQGH